MHCSTRTKLIGLQMPEGVTSSPMVHKFKGLSHLFVSEQSKSVGDVVACSSVIQYPTVEDPSRGAQ